MKNKFLRVSVQVILLAVLVWLAAAFLASCGRGGNSVGAGSKPALASHDTTSPRAGLEPAPTIPLADVLAQIDAYPVPKGVSAETWTMLTNELKKQLVARSKDGKTLSITPTGTSNAVSDLAAVSNGAGTQATLTWTEALAGDCNNDGQVGIADLQPIAAHYGETSTGPGSAAYLADANGDGLVSITDLQPIAADYSMHIEGYQVHRGHWNGTSTDWEATFRPNVDDPANTSFSADRTTTPPATSRPAYTYLDDISTLVDKANVRYILAAYGDGAAGAESNEAIMPAVGHSVSGTVLQSGVGVAGVVMTLTPGGLNATTQADGTYSITGVVDGGYTLTPSKAGYMFTPASNPVTMAGADVTGQDFTAYAGPAQSAWPKFHQNQFNAGLSPYVGAQTNTVKWAYATGQYVYSSPAVGADGTVYVGSSDGNVYALNPADGNHKWAYATGGVESSPAIGADGTVYVGSDDFNIYALNPADGSVKWAYLTGSGVTSSPAVGADGTVYAGSWDDKVYALNPTDGSVKWSYATGNFVASSPAIGVDGTVYVGSYDHKVYALNPADGSVKWSHATNDLVYSSPSVGADGTVYVGGWDGNVYALNPADGSLKWSYYIGNLIGSSPSVAADGTVCVGSHDHNVYALNPDGTKRWQYTTGDKVESSPAIGADGTVYVGSDDSSVYALNPADGSVKWTYATGGAVKSSPAIGADGTVYVGSWDFKVYAFGP